MRVCMCESVSERLSVCLYMSVSERKCVCLRGTMAQLAKVSYQKPGEPGSSPTHGHFLILPRSLSHSFSVTLYCPIRIKATHPSPPQKSVCVCVSVYVAGPERIIVLRVAGVRIYDDSLNLTKETPQLCAPWVLRCAKEEPGYMVIDQVFYGGVGD